MSRKVPFALAIPVGAMALALAAPASAGMTVSTFLAKAAPLRANPFTALTNPDYQVLKAEADAATRQLRAEGTARKAAGKTPIACMPEGEKIGILQMLGGLDTLSAAEKKLPLKDGYAKVLAKTYPCR
jgi:ABC-type glycerol-3-phosphate transport system substrate-binding protein